MQERDIQIAMLAHAIRLGKRPRPGQMMGCNISIREMDTETGAVSPGDKMPFDFVVTGELLAAAAAAINAQRVQYREPKTSVMALGEPNQEALVELWKWVRRMP